MRGILRAESKWEKSGMNSSVGGTIRRQISSTMTRDIKGLEVENETDFSLVSIHMLSEAQLRIPQSNINPQYTQ